MTFKNLYNRSILLSTNKALELEVYFASSQLLAIELDIRRKTDHAGIQITLSFLGITLAIRLYDIRHWDIETNTYD